MTHSRECSGRNVGCNWMPMAHMAHGVGLRPSTGVDGVEDGGEHLERVE